MSQLPLERSAGALLWQQWTEWEAMKWARPLFEGHLSPKYPFWGYYGEGDLRWAEREIEAASQHEINMFIVDWYWYNGVLSLQE
jgi:Glycosyltransferase WbsX